MNVSRVRVGVIGTGVIAQVMHLHYLRELSDRFDTVAICDLSEGSAQANAAAYDVPGVYTDAHALLDADLDAVLVLTSGSHAPLAVEAARRGRHVFVEKPMCFSVTEAAEMFSEAERAGVVLMVGYPKRYDGAYARLAEVVREIGEPRLLRVTTTEAPWRPYLEHYPLIEPGVVDAGVVERLRGETQGRLAAAIGTDDPTLTSFYQNVLLDTLVHELNTVRGLWGEPDRLEHVDRRPGALHVHLGYGDAAASIHWLDVPGMTRYAMEFSVTGTKGRATLTFPSPYLRNAPALLEVERGTGESVSSSLTQEITSYESGFRRELEAFHDAITRDAPVPTDGRDGARDVALCGAIVRSLVERSAIDNPSDY